MERRTPEQIRKNMQSVKSKGSKIERMLGKELWKRGYRYRKNNNKVYGKPDFTFKKWKIAIFCDGEFWHGKDWDTRKKEHKTNKDFWHQKIERNIERDKEVNKKLKNEGWTVLRFLGKQIKSDLEKCVNEIEDQLNEIKRGN